MWTETLPICTKVVINNNTQGWFSMRSQAVIGGFVALLQVGSAIKCSENEILKKYRINENSIEHHTSRDTPPSETREDWWINICEEHTSEAPKECKGGDVLCGTTNVVLKGKDPLLTQVIDFPADTSSRVSVNDQQQVIVNLDKASWGSHSMDAQLTFICDSSKKSDTVTSSTWHEQQIQFVIEGPSGCLKSGENDGNDDDHSGDDNKDRPDHDDPVKHKGSGFGGWFLWLVTYAILFALIYLLTTSYMATRGGTFNDFREEFVERSTGLASSLPQFAKEMVAKVIGGGSSSQRGGYSAV